MMATETISGNLSLASGKHIYKIFMSHRKKIMHLNEPPHFFRGGGIRHIFM